MEKRDAIVCDLDGTLMDSRHREHFLEEKPKNYDSFNAASSQDKPIKTAVDYVEGALRNGWTVIFLTGRDEKFKKLTVTWLKKNIKGLTNHNWELFMRPTTSFATAVDYKEKVYEQRIKHNYNVHLVMDDDQEILDMFKNKGLLTLDFSKKV